MTPPERDNLLRSYAAGTITAIELRRRFGGATYGDLLRMLADAGLTLPQAPVQGREDRLAMAREWMFPKPPHG